MITNAFDEAYVEAKAIYRTRLGKLDPLTRTTIVMLLVQMDEFEQMRREEFEDNEGEEWKEGSPRV